MSVIRVTVDEQNLHITEAPKIAAQGVNENYIEFEFDPSWSEFGKSVLFYREDDEATVYETVVDANNQALVPHEVTDKDGRVCFGLVGVKGEIIYTSEILKYKVVKGLYTSGQESQPPTPGIYDQMLNLAGSVLKKTENIEDDQEAFQSQINAQVAQFIASHGGTVTGTKRTVTTLWSGQVYETGTTINLSDDPVNYDYIEIEYYMLGNSALAEFTSVDFRRESGVVIRESDIRSQLREKPSALNIVEFTLKKSAEDPKQYSLESGIWYTSGGADYEALVTDIRESAYINMITGIKYENISASKDAELTDIRAGADGVNYSTAGQAVRAQVQNLQSAIDEADGNIEDLDGRVEVIEADSLGYVDNAYVENGIAYFTHNGEVVFEVTGIGGGSGGGGGSGNNAILTVTNALEWLTKTISEGSECSVAVNWSSLENDQPTGNGTMTIRVNNIVKSVLDVAQGTVNADITKYLKTGINKVRVTVADAYNNTSSIIYTVSVVNLSLSSSFDAGVIRPAGQDIEYTYTPTGATEKTVYFIVDGSEAARAVVSVSGRQVYQLLDGLSHGSHSLLVYFTAEIDGSEVRSNELYYDLIVVNSESTAPIIASTFRSTTATQYETLSIPYTVYDPQSLTAPVKLYVNNELVTTLTVDRTGQTWTYRPDEVGTLNLKIVSGATEKTFALTVADSGIDVEAETEALALYLTAYGRSNNESDPGSWTYKDISATLSGFNFTSDGWVSDGDGNTVLRVSGDARVTIPYQAFKNDFRSTGKTIEIEFATRNVLNYDTVIMSCMSGGRGVELTAQKALLKSEQSEISTQFKEDEHVRVSFVVEKRAENRLIYIYTNGVMSGVVQYPADDDFSQVAPVDISIGSNFCMTDIYCIRVYDNDLTRFQVLDNWIADTHNIEDMLYRYRHNNVYDEYGQIVISKLPTDLPYMVLSCPQLPQYKGDKKTISGQYVDPANPARSFSFSGAQADVQGTSSQYYARKNYKIKYKNGFTMTGTGETVSDYPLRPGAIPTNAFTFKADVASSEGANNVELARLYNDACVYKTPAQEENSAVRQGIDGFPIVMFWDDGNNVTFLGKYNFNNDKGTEEVFGFTDGDESWEVKNNTSNRVLWKSADYSGSDWLNDFEGRYPDGYTDPTNLRKFAEWIVTTDTTAATNQALPSPVTYDEVEYTSDTAEYRLAKFKAELGNYVELDSAIFYYLFTELFLMVDSRAKNMFPSFIGEEVNS